MYLPTEAQDGGKLCETLPYLSHQLQSIEGILTRMIYDYCLETWRDRGWSQFITNHCYTREYNYSVWFKSMGCCGEITRELFLRQLPWWSSLAFSCSWVITCNALVLGGWSCSKHIANLLSPTRMLACCHLYGSCETTPVLDHNSIH